MNQSQNKDQIHKKYQAILQILCTQELKITRQELTSLLNIPIVDRSLGCIFGAFIGDALGSYCQFQGMQSESKMDIAMSMPGGGPFYLAAGQVTDDSEMALHMLEALLKYNSNIGVHQQNQYIQYSIAQQYIKWVGTQPFDIGITCNKAIQALKNNISTQSLTLNQFNENKQQYLSQIQKSMLQIQKVNKQSLSNGILMRITPLSILHSYLLKSSKNSIPNLQQLIYNEAKLTHSHPIALDSSVQWVQMLSKLISRPTDPQQNKQQQLEELNSIFRQFIQKDNNVGQIKNDILKEIEQKQPILATQKIGYFKHAYHFAIYEMKAIEFMLKNIKKPTQTQNQIKPALSNQINGQYYKNSLKFVIKQGGDTDTNACIIGGFLGAITGFNKLPKQYLVKQLGLKLNPNSRKKYGKFYQPSRGFVNTIRLIRKFIV